MSNVNDEASQTFSGVGAGNQTANVDVKTGDNGESVSAFITEAGGGDPGDITVITERYSEIDDTWYEFSRSALTSNGNERSVTDEAVPERMRYRVQNDTGSAQDYVLNVVSY